MNLERHIVAIDLGTSKIAITVAIVNGDDIQVMYHKEGPSDGIRSSAVVNPAKASKCIRKVIDEAENELGIKISKVVVCKPKYEIRQEVAEIKMVRTNPDECISEKEIKTIKELAQKEYELDNPDIEELFGAVAQAFSTEDELMLIEDDVVGMIGQYLEGNFKVFVGNQKDMRNIDAVFKNLGIQVLQKYFTPDSTAKAVLYDSEMDNGVALVDFGAGATSVSVYTGNVMRHYASIPFGGKSITNDIKNECNITEKLAENIKLGYGVCMPERLQNLSEKVLRINSSNPAISPKELPVKYLSEIITARVKEIINAVLYEIEKSGLADQLKSGIVVTGGCAELANCCCLFKEMSGYNVRDGHPKKVFYAAGCDEVFSTKATCSIGMILAAKNEEEMDCAWYDSGNERPAAVSGTKETAAKQAEEKSRADSEPAVKETPAEVKEDMSESAPGDEAIEAAEKEAAERAAVEKAAAEKAAAEKVAAEKAAAERAAVEKAAAEKAAAEAEAQKSEPVKITIKKEGHEPVEKTVENNGNAKSGWLENFKKKLDKYYEDITKEKP